MPGDGVEQSAVIMRFKMVKAGDIQPWMTVKAVNTKRSLDVRLREDRPSRHRMVGGQHIHVVSASAKLVGHHVADELISPEIMRRIQVG